MTIKQIREINKERLNNISYSVFDWRVRNRGLERALSTPHLGQGGDPKRGTGEKTVKGLRRESGAKINYIQFYWRVNKAKRTHLDIFLQETGKGDKTPRKTDAQD